MASASFFTLLCLFLLLVPHLGSASRVSYRLGHGRGRAGRFKVVRSSENTGRVSRRPVACSSTHSGHGNERMNVVHRMSPCSPLGGAYRDQRKQSLDDVLHYDALHYDALRLRLLFGVDHTGGEAAAAGPAPAPSSGVTVPATGDPLRSYPGAFQYHVVGASFGTPPQRFTVGFDTATGGATLLQCTPCAAGGQPCDRPAFDPSLSSSLAQIPCGSPDCPINGCSGPSCTFTATKNGDVLFNETAVTDTFALSASSTLDRFRFLCLEMGITSFDASSGILDLSRNSHSLASRAPSSPGTVAFSYCLPEYGDGGGFLSIGAARPAGKVNYANLHSNAARPNHYLVQLAGLGLGGPDLQLPSGALAGDSLMELHATLTYLRPDAYAALRDRFRQYMSQYPAAPPSGRLDTCYNFTGLNIYLVPIATINFDGGASLDVDQMLYFQDPTNPFSVGCLAFAPLPDGTPATIAAVMGTMAQTTTEVVYDVLGDKVGFVPYTC